MTLQSEEGLPEGNYKNKTVSLGRGSCEGRLHWGALWYYEGSDNFLWQMLCSEWCLSDLFRILLRSVRLQCLSAGKLSKQMMTQMTTKSWSNCPLRVLRKLCRDQRNSQGKKTTWRNKSRLKILTAIAVFFLFLNSKWWGGASVALSQFFLTRLVVFHGQGKYSQIVPLLLAVGELHLHCLWRFSWLCTHECL